jgi:transcription elongation factor Elf1
MMDKLLPCPFCGGEAYLNDILTRKGRDIEIGCRKCGIKMLKGFIRYSFDPIYCRELAILAWNRRMHEKADKG